MYTLHHHPNGCRVYEPWWKSAVFYQVYPASFKDSNNDGWGDIPGLISKIDHLHQLGVDVVWLSPMFESPQKDMGYDISNYQDVYPRYGTLSDVDTLIHACHSRGMKLILDLVVNHTSSLHPWFLESRSSKTNPKRNWYIWKPPRFDSSGARIPPTNWRSYFAGPTWTWDPHTQEYYLHLYDSSQPDLNWETPSCREAIYSHTMIFWLDRGIDGFRIDTVNKYSKNTAFPDAPITIPLSTTQPAPEMWCNGPRIHDFLREMNVRVLTPYAAVSVGELSNTPLPSQVLPYISASANQLSMVFEFSTIRLGTGNLFSGKYTYHPFPLSTLKSHIATWQTFTEGTDAWHTVFIENHDNGRAVSRFGDTSTPDLWERSAKTIAMWQVTLTGTLFLYQGQEIGMKNMPATWGIDEYKDVEGRGFYDEAVASGDAEKVKRTMYGLGILARDHSRLPFQWDGKGEFAGFMDGSSSLSSREGEEAKPWMKIHDDYKTINAETQMGDEESVLGYYKKMLKLRKEFADLFIFGSFKLLIPGDENIFAYVKEGIEGDINGQVRKRRGLVVMNFTREEHQIGLDVGEELGCGHGNDGEVRFLAGTYRDAENLGVTDELTMPLRPWEGRVYVSFGV